jgi:hypothetical protein
MSDVGYVAAGYLLTGGVVAVYAVSLRRRLRRALRRIEGSDPGRAGS